MLVQLLVRNPFRRFYESIDGVQVHERGVEIWGKHLKELGCGRGDLARLVSRLEED